MNNPDGKVFLDSCIYTHLIFCLISKPINFYEKDEFDDATACSAACTTGALHFGDINEEESKIAELAKDERAYHLLEHVGTKPNVFYHVKVRNTKEA